MKKLIIFCLFFVSVDGFSQSFIKDIMGRLTYGVKVGINYSNYTNANFSTDPLVGFHAGALVNLRLNKQFSIEEEFLFSSQGAKTKDNIFGKQKITLNYMSVPILLRYRTQSGFYFEAGPQMSGLISDNVDNSLVNGSYAKKVDISLATGLGYQFNHGLGIGVRYISGLSGIGGFQSSTINPDFRNSVMQGGVFYIF